MEKLLSQPGKLCTGYTAPDGKKNMTFMKPENTPTILGWFERPSMRNIIDRSPSVVSAITASISMNSKKPVKTLMPVMNELTKRTMSAMASGIRRALGADIGLSVTGIAGPGGGMPHKPVGLVWLGLSAPRGEWAFSHIWPGSRIENKEDSAQAALQLVVDYLRGALDGQD